MHGLVVGHSSERGVSKQTIGGPASRSAEGRPAVPARAHRVSHRGNRRDPLPARRGSEDRRRFGLCCRPASDVKSHASRPSSALTFRRSWPSSRISPSRSPISRLTLSATWVQAGVVVHAFNHGDVAGTYGMIRKSGCRLTRNLLRRPTRVQPKQRPAVERRPVGRTLCTPIRGLADRGLDRPPLASQAIPS